MACARSNRFLLEGIKRHGAYSQRDSISVFASAATRRSHALGPSSSFTPSRNYATVVDKPCEPPGKFPFPTHPSPTAHEIFHLPRGATQKEIKSRCALHLSSSFGFGGFELNVPPPERYRLWISPLSPPRFPPLPVFARSQGPLAVPGDHCSIRLSSGQNLIPSSWCEAIRMVTGDIELRSISARTRSPPSRSGGLTTPPSTIPLRGGQLWSEWEERKDDFGCGGLCEFTSFGWPGICSMTCVLIQTSLGVGTRDHSDLCLTAAAGPIR